MEQQAATPIFANGSQWLRADFHLHTQADKEFTPKAASNGEFASNYINRLQAEGIRIGVITNHNKFDLEEFKALYKKARKADIWLLPGVELSVNDGANGVHCLIAFDYDKWIDKGENYIEDHFLSEVFVGIRNRENENTRCKYGFKDLFDRLAEHRRQGRDSFMLLAHVEDKSGFFKELGGGRIKEFGENLAFRTNVLGLQKVRTRDEVQKWQQWLGDLPAFVEGSDCKSPDQVGVAHQVRGEAKCCYLKLGAYQFQALKYALLDHKNRVGSFPPEVSHTHLAFVRVHGSRLKAEVPLSHNLNTLIGIRGSGKSSLLELIRYALELKPASDADYKNRLVKHVLGSGGTVELGIKVREGKTYRIRRVLGEPAVAYDGDQLLPVGVRKLLQNETILYYGQKDLSYRESDANERLFERLVEDRLLDLRNSQQMQEQQVKAQVQAFLNQNNLNEKQADYQEEQDALEHRIQIFKDKAIDQKLAKQAAFQKDRDRFQHVERRIKDLHQSLLNALAEQEEGLDELRAYQSQEHAEAFGQLAQRIQQLLGDVRAFKEKLSGYEQIATFAHTQYEAVQKGYVAMLDEFAKIQQEIAAPNLQANDYLEATRKLNNVKLRLAEVRKQIDRRALVKQTLLQALQQLNELWHQQFQVMQAEADRINAQEWPIEIKVVYKGRKDDMLDYLKGIMRGQNIQSRNLEAIVGDYPDFIQLFKDLENGVGRIHEILSGGDQFSRFHSRFYEQLPDFLVYRPADRVVIRYNGKPLEEHSLGQRASAVILFLLTQQENSIVLIDQPEDDLDNQSIFRELIELLKAQKDQTQFIFATHNPNIPVLGDAEQVLAMIYTPSEMNLSPGSIDQPEMQETIINIMEGGREAFQLRQRIYDTWKH
jgi:chromosome segregation protein